MSNPNPHYADCRGCTKECIMCGGVHDCNGCEIQGGRTYVAPPTRGPGTEPTALREAKTGGRLRSV
jgi:hypothetical protein